MRLQGKLVLLMVLFAALFALCSWSIQECFILPNILEIERTQVGENLRRTISVLTMQSNALSSVCADWADWDDAYRFVADHNQAFVKSNLVESTFSDNHLNLVLFYDIHGNYLAGNTYDLQAGRFFPFPDFPLTRLPPTLGTLHALADHAVSGIIATSRGPLVVSCQTIHRSDNSGSSRGFLVMGYFLSSRGFLVMGYFLDSRKIAELGKELVQNLKILPVGVLAKPEKRILAALERSPDSSYQAPDGKIMHAYTTFPDVHGRPALLIEVNLPRNVFRQGLRAMRLFMALSILAGLSVIFLLLLLTQTMVVRPIDTLIRHIVSIRDSGDQQPLKLKRGATEIRTLANEFDSLLAKLDEKRREQESARLDRERLIEELRAALAKVKQLKGLLPICSICKKIRDDKGYWKQLESYISEHSEADFTHSICQECLKKHYGEFYSDEDDDQ